MQQREALNAAGVCDQSDRFNCKYCRRAGRDCEGYAPSEGVPPTTGPDVPRRNNRGAIDELFAAFDRAARALSEGQQSARLQTLKALYSEPLPARHLVREEVIEFDQAPYYIDNGVAIETPGPLQRVKVWRFHYSDGDVEQITSRRAAHATA